MELRPYQETVIEAALRVANPLVVAPCGAGKTVIAAAIIQAAELKHILFLTHRRELVHQAINKWH